MANNKYHMQFRKEGRVMPYDGMEKALLLHYHPKTVKAKDNSYHYF